MFVVIADPRRWSVGYALNIRRTGDGGTLPDMAGVFLLLTEPC